MILASTKVADKCHAFAIGIKRTGSHTDRDGTFAVQIKAISIFLADFDREEFAGFLALEGQGAASTGLVRHIH